MPNPIKWEDVGTVVLVLNGDASAPTLKNLTAGGLKISNEIDPGATPDSFMDFRLRARFQADPGKALVLCWFIIDVGDAGAIEDGSDSIEPNRNPDFVFVTRAVTVQQIIGARQVEIPKSPFKVLLKNDTSVQMTNTDDENQLHSSKYNREIQ